MKTPKYFRLRIRDAADYVDDLVLSSFPDDENPYLIDPPSGDGESFDPITGAPTTGSYKVTAQDWEISATTRVITEMLADVYGRQQLLLRKAWVEQSSDGVAWTTLVVGYITRISLINAIKFEFAIGQSRRIEQSRTVFKEATEQFPGITCVIGGPVIGGFIPGFLEDYGGWTFEVDEDTAVHTKLALVSGFDPRKPGDPLDTFTSTSTAIADFTNDWARNYFEPSSEWMASDIHGYFPSLRARLLVAGGTDPDDVITLIPLARPAEVTLSGPWYAPYEDIDKVNKITGFGTSQLYLPKVDVDGNPFDPALATEYQVWVYAVPISKDNPLHWYGHPVDFWEAHRIDAGITYDASVLPALKTLVGDARRIAIRTGESGKLSDIDLRIVYGPFRLSSRLEDGDEVLFSTSVYNNDPPIDTITLEKLRSTDGTVFDNDESTITTAIVVKSDRIRKWSTSEEAEQPEIDGLISSDAYPQALENSGDDIPAGAVNEQEMGDIPGMIWVDGSGPINLEMFLTNLGAEMFDRAGRGFITCELKCLPVVTNKLGAEVLLDLPHLPGSVSTESPVTQRGIAPMPFQIIQRTETPEGPDLVLVNSISSELAGAGAPSGALLPEFTLEVSWEDPVRYGRVTITNALDLIAAGLSTAVYYAQSATEPAEGAGVHSQTFAPVLYPPSGFDVGPVEEGAHLWVQLRAEAPGFRPGAWTAWQDVELTPVPPS